MSHSGIRYLDAARLQEARDVFHSYARVSGKLKLARVPTLLHYLGFNPTAIIWTKLSSRHDPHNTGTVDLDTFLQICEDEELPEVDVEADLRAAFNALDKAGRGTLRADTVRRLLTSRGDKMNLSEAEAVLQNVPGDRELIFDEFRLLMLGDRLPSMPRSQAAALISAALCFKVARGVVETSRAKAEQREQLRLAAERGREKRRQRAHPIVASFIYELIAKDRVTRLRSERFERAIVTIQICYRARTSSVLRDELCTAAAAREEDRIPESVISTVHAFLWSKATEKVLLEKRQVWWTDSVSIIQRCCRAGASRILLYGLIGSQSSNGATSHSHGVIKAFVHSKHQQIMMQRRRLEFLRNSLAIVQQCGSARHSTLIAISKLAEVRRQRSESLVTAFCRYRLAGEETERRLRAFRASALACINRCCRARIGSFHLRAILYRPAIVKTMFIAVFVASFGSRLLRRVRIRRARAGAGWSPAREHRCRPFEDLIRLPTLTKPARRKLHDCLCADCRRLYRGPVAQAFLRLAQSVSAVRALQMMQLRFRFRQRRARGITDPSLFGKIMCTRCAEIADAVSRRIIAHSSQPNAEGKSLVRFLPENPELFENRVMMLKAKSKKKTVVRRRVSHAKAGYLCRSCHALLVWFAELMDVVASRRQESQLSFSQRSLMLSQQKKKKAPLSREAAGLFLVDWMVCRLRLKRARKAREALTTTTVPNEANSCERCKVLVSMTLPVLEGVDLARSLERDTQSNDEANYRRHYRCTDSGLALLLSQLHPNAWCIERIVQAAAAYAKERRSTLFGIHRWRWRLYWREFNKKKRRRNLNRVRCTATAEHGVILFRIPRGSETPSDSSLSASVTPSHSRSQTPAQRTLSIDVHNADTLLQSYATRASQLWEAQQDRAMELLLAHEAGSRAAIVATRRPQFKDLFAQYKQSMRRLNASAIDSSETSSVTSMSLTASALTPKTGISLSPR